LRVDVGQQRQKIRLPERAPRLAHGRQVLTDLADLLPPLAERSPRPSTQDPTYRQKECKPLLRRQSDERLGLLVRGVGFPAQLVGNGRQHPREGETRGMRHLLGQRERSVKSSQSLVGIAQQPEGHGRHAVATHSRKSGRLSMNHCMRRLNQGSRSTAAGPSVAERPSSAAAGAE
jgi:hypothetical protein